MRQFLCLIVCVLGIPVLEAEPKLTPAFLLSAKLEQKDTFGRSLLSFPQPNRYLLEVTSAGLGGNITGTVTLANDTLFLRPTACDNFDGKQCSAKNLTEYTCLLQNTLNSVRFEYHLICVPRVRSAGKDSLTFPIPGTQVSPNLKRRFAGTYEVITLGGISGRIVSPSALRECPQTSCRKLEYLPAVFGDNKVRAELPIGTKFSTLARTNARETTDGATDYWYLIDVPRDNPLLNSEVWVFGKYVEVN